MFRSRELRQNDVGFLAESELPMRRIPPLPFKITRNSGGVQAMVNVKSTPFINRHKY